MQGTIVLYRFSAINWSIGLLFGQNTIEVKLETVCLTKFVTFNINI